MSVSAARIEQLCDAWCAATKVPGASANNCYALGKLSELVFELFVGLEPAREKLSENLHFVVIISPKDFKLKKHQKMWADIQKSLIGKTKNIGLERAPIDRLTVRNATITKALASIWSIYEECKIAP
jgi:hypothetical protein